MKIKKFYIQYMPYIVFSNNDRQYIRRLYRVSENEYYYRFNNNKVTISEKELYV